MFKLIKWVIIGAFVAGFIWFGMNVKLGNHTLFGHVSRIWKSDETQDLVKGTKEAAGPTVDKVKRAVEAGVEEAKKPPPDAPPKVDSIPAPDLEDAPPPAPTDRVQPRKRSGRRAP